MANPFARSAMFHKLGHMTNTVAFRLLPTPRSIVVVTTTGRKTGKRRARAMRAVQDGEHLYAVAILGAKTAWVANIRANPDVRVKLGTRWHDATAHVVSDPGEREQARRAYCAITGWYDYADFANFTWSFPTRAKMLAGYERWLDEGTLVAFDLAGGAAATG
jgi:deazaflavin-dependent oxidoreductase (nitroreductase family)